MLVATRILTFHLQVYGVSLKASDLRKLTQDLNLGRQEAEAAKEVALLSAADAIHGDDAGFDEALIEEWEHQEAEHFQSQPQSEAHKWDAYVDQEQVTK